MPIFEYRCTSCDHVEEVLQKHTDPPPPSCPACHGNGTLARKLSLTSFQLKGGGWYKDLYSSPKAETKADAKSESKAETKAADPKSETKDAKKKAESKSEAKPAAPSSAAA